MAGFRDALAAFENKVKDAGDVVVTRVVVALAEETIERSPVGDRWLWKKPWNAPKDYEGGNFKANWQYGLNYINTLVTDDIDPTGEISLNELSKIPKRAAGHIHYWTNSLPYAIPLENGHSERQAPQGIVGITITGFQHLVNITADYVRVNGIGT